ncbi:oligosaccharyltransferase complex subunit epsilon [Rhodotorula kratochvilovae]
MPPRRVAARPPPPPPAPLDLPSPAPPAASTSAAALAGARGKTREQGAGLAGAVSTLWDNYRLATTPRLKLIDSFMLFLMLTGVAQFLYCFAVTNYPFNAFIGGFAATVGQFVVLGALRIQSNPDNKSTFPSLSPERAFGDFLFGSLILHFFVWNYLG